MSSSPEPDTVQSATTGRSTRKARNLLKNFYGLQAAEQARKRPDPLDIESTAFHAEVFLNKALHEESLVDLIQRDNHLVSEIKDLDGQMKTLVCENYNKFISATDSIRKMRANVENMESGMERLSTSMDAITEASNNINDSLAERRSRIHQLGGIHTLLKKLNFVFELPTRLKQCLNKQKYAQAVQYHSQTAHLLVHYRHIAVFRKIEDECKVVMDEVGKKIREKMHHNSSTTSDIVESFGLLIGLATQQPQDLAKEYLQIFHKQFQKCKATALKHLSTMAPPSPTTDSPVDTAVAKVSYLDSSLLTEFALLVKSFEDYFLVPRVDSPVEREGSPARPVYFAKMPVDARESIREGFSDMVEKATGEYFGIVEGFMPSLESVSPTASLAVFDKLHTDVLGMDSLKGTARMDQRVQALTLGWLGKVVGDVFARVRQGFFGKFMSTKGFEGNDLHILVDDAVSWVQKTLTQQCLPVLEGFITPNSGFVKTAHHGFHDFMQQVRTCLEELWYDIQAQMMDLTCPKAHTAPNAPPVLSLILARISKDFACNIVDDVYQAYGDRLFKQSDSQSSPSRDQRPPHSKDRRGLAVATGSRSKSGHDEAVEEMMNKSNEICTMWKDTSQKLLSRYVKVIGMRDSLAIRRYFETRVWLESPDPTKPSSIWDRVLTDLDTCNWEVLQLYDNEGILERKEGHLGNSGRRPSHRPGHSRNTSLAGGNYPYMNASGSNSSFKSGGMHRSQGTLPSPTHQNTLNQLMSGIDRLFSERVEYFGLVEGTHSGILMGLVKVLIKSFIEEVRMVALNKSGFRQIQLDVEFLRIHLWKYSQDDRLLFTLLDEVLSSAYRRAIDTQGFERDTLDKLLSSHHPPTSNHK
ncbi:hypothetical protein SeLEV6574_g06321 [Synchytrium endobioticum]|uniref:Vacuolar protein sorting-associated protein 51 homolog n=1 Tax=Synchytrium endobioticum TaxID=286115 RepID=A0A507CP81_9FUNG|nr:hypothetical protein SeLEV6574_g06321 [Synchytrium endobioticum]